MASAKAQRLASIYTAEKLASAGAENTQLLTDGYAKGRSDLTKTTNEGMKALDWGHDLAVGQLGKGHDAARGEYTEAAKLYDPFVSAGKVALGQYGDLAGVNGTEGYDRATASFRASPGYRFAVDEATDAVARKASALGSLGSGNTMAAISDRAGNMADQEFGSYAGRLQGITQMGLGATGAQAALTKGIGDLYAAEGTGKAALDTGQGVAKAGMYTTLGQGIANQDTGLATALANTNMSVATGQSAAVTNAAQATDAAKMANENLLLGSLGLGINLLTGGAGQKAGQGLLSTLGKAA